MARRLPVRKPLRPRKPSAPARPARPIQPVPAGGRHREILAAALELIAEQGYAGASLRELARRVGMSQPSLYHYFASKQDLVLQIVETYAGAMMMPMPVITDAVQLPRLCATMVRALYETRDHPQFVRVMFATSRLDPQFGARCRDIFVDRVHAALQHLVAPWVARGELREADAIDVLRLVIYGIGFRYMEERVLFDDGPMAPDFDRYVEFVVETAELRIRQLRGPA